MSNSRILDDSFYSIAPIYIDFATLSQDEIKALIGDNDEFNEKLDENLIWKMSDKEQTQPDTITKDAFRGVLLANKNVKLERPDIQSMDQTDKISSFIRSSLNIDKDGYKILNNFYRQPPGDLFVTSYFGSVFKFGLTDEENNPLYPTSFVTKNVFKDKDGVIHLETKATLGLISDSNELKYVIGSIGYQYVLTKDGFQLEKFAATNDLIFDLCFNRAIEPSELPEKVGALAYRHRLLTQLLTIQKAYLPGYVALQSLIENADVFWKNGKQDLWLDMVLSITTNIVFNDLGNVRKDIMNILENKNPDEETKKILLKEYFKNIVASALDKNKISDEPLITQDKSMNDILEYKHKYSPTDIFHEINEQRKIAHPPPGFFARNWPVFAVGLGLVLAVAGVIALGILTFGIGPAIIGAVSAAVGSATILTEAAALAVGITVLNVGAVASYAALFGLGVAAVKSYEALNTSSTKEMHEKGLKLDAKEKMDGKRETPNLDDEDATLSTSSSAPKSKPSSSSSSDDEDHQPPKIDH